MYGDFSRLTFAPIKQRTRVLQQQGRVLCDADWNEQVSILLHALRGVTADLIGPHGGPAHACGFEIITDAKKLVDEPPGRRKAITELLEKRGGFAIGRGRYYVAGMVSENDTDIHVGDQPVWKSTEDETAKAGRYVIFLDVWEAYASAVQDNAMLDVALGGLETAARSRAAWAVRAHSIPENVSLDPDPAKESDTRKEWQALVDAWQPANRGLLKARTAPPPEDDLEPCSIPPDARFRGGENQLYRVEIHDRGTAWPADGDAGKKSKATRMVGRATLKFSRVNGSTVFAVKQLADNTTVTLDVTPRDTRIDLRAGDWVEILDDELATAGLPGPLRRVADVNLFTRQVKLEPDAEAKPVADVAEAKHPFLRRWDGVANVIETDGDRWITLEDGVQIQFQKAATGEPHVYRSGDYWLIPARVLSADVEWPRTGGQPDALPPLGVQHVYAPLAILTRKADGPLKKAAELRRQFMAMAQEVADA